jgi:hypothetical protein
MQFKYLCQYNNNNNNNNERISLFVASYILFDMFRPVWIIFRIYFKSKQIFGYFAILLLVCAFVFLFLVLLILAVGLKISDQILLL